MNPDIVVGLALIAVSVAGFAVGLVATRWTLQRQANLEAARADIDDLVKVAQAAGILIPTVQGGRSSGQMAAAIAFHAPTPVLPIIEDEQLPGEVDHDRCDDCGRVICQCQDGPEPALCQDTVEQGCRHSRSLCLTCMAACPECLADLRSQGVLSQYVPDWWNR